MIRSTPDRPEIAATRSIPFGVNFGGRSLFSINVENALFLICDWLHCATGNSYESADHALTELRLLALPVTHQIEAVKAL